MLGTQPNRRDLLKVGVKATLYPFPFKNGGKMKCAPGGKLPLAPTKATMPAAPTGQTKWGAPQNIQDAIKMALGGKLGNETFGDKTTAAGPRSMADGGEIVAQPPGLGRRIAGVFNRDIRTDNRYQMALQKALSGGGSSDFRAASEFTIPTSGVVAKRGEQIYVTPQSRTRVITPGTPGIPAVEGTPESREKVQVGTKQKYTPSFTETGAYGAPIAGAPGAGTSYTNYPKGMNPGLKAALERAIAAGEETTSWNGKSFKAGEFVEEPEFKEVVTPATPGTPAVPGTPDVTENYIYPFAKKGGSGSERGNWAIKHDTPLEWIDKGKLDTQGGGSLFFKKKTTSRDGAKGRQRHIKGGGKGSNKRGR